MQVTNKKKTQTAVIVFSLIAVLSGWLGRGIDLFLGAKGENTPGQLLWLILPLLSVIVIKKVFRNSQSKIGFKPNFKGNKKYYLMSLLFFPLVTSVYLVIGIGMGFISLNTVSPEVLVPLMISMLIAQTFKNVFEEFSWRGYLAPELLALNINRYVSYLMVGLVWAAWHIPYNHIFISYYRTTITAWYYPAFFMGVIVLAFAYGEIRYRVKAIWPALIMHTIGNALLNTLILSRLINLSQADTLVRSIGMEGGITIGLTLVVTVFILVISSKADNRQLNKV